MFRIKDAFQTLAYAFLYNICIFLPLMAVIQLETTYKISFLFVLSCVFALVIIHLFPVKTFQRRYLTVLYRGYRSLEIFIASSLFILLTVVVFLIFYPVSWKFLLIGILWLILMEAVLFWNGMLRIFFSSVQLGIRTRVIMTIFSWVPLLNLYLLLKVMGVVRKELTFEYQKDLIDDDVEVQSIQCKTKYPILLVHGVFFRDVKYLNYWGRIPRFLKQRGATIYYGKQESAQSVAYCGQQLANTIQRMLAETGCEKVNIIAHSKGGLDSRYAISNCGMAQYVASLTTINTPHHGCIFANYLLKKAPARLVKQVSKKYNAIFKKLGDQEADFLAAVTDLTDEACEKLNTQMPNQAGVYYQGITTYMNSACNGKFPLYLSYPLVKHFDGKNDGLVSVESANYFEVNRVVAPKSRRGISHADVIDLNRENIESFDVREFYQEIVMDLITRGY